METRDKNKYNTQTHSLIESLKKMNQLTQSYIIFLFVLGFHAGFGQSNKNYVKTHIVQVPGFTNVDTDLNTKPKTQVSTATNFVDGLGRPVQNVIKQGSYGSNDIVQHIEYDAFGRQVKTHLLYTEGTNGLFKLNAATAQNVFFDTHFGGNSGDYAFLQDEPEASPLHRVLKTYSPGKAWSKSDGNRPISFNYRTNSSTDNVRLWTMDDFTAKPTSTTNYADDTSVNGGALYVTETTDEEGNTVQEFKDKQGSTILKKVEKATNSYLSTYYIYDDMGNLRYVLPPEAVKSIGVSTTVSNAIRDDYCFYYIYDDRNRMVVKKVPGAEEVHMVYDQRDRLVMTQDGNQRTAGQWTFTKYDELNRPAITGIFTDDTLAHDRVHHQTQVNGMLVLNVSGSDDVDNNIKEGVFIQTNHYDGVSSIYRAEQHIEFQAGFHYDSNLNGSVLADIQNPIPNIDGAWIDIYYDKTYPEINDSEVLTVSYYDNYDFTSEVFLNRDYAFDIIHGKKPASHLSVKGQETGFKTKILGTQSDFITNVSFYDNKYQLIQSISVNHKGGKEINTFQYDFTGQLRNTYQEHQNPGADVAATTIKMSYSYDHGGRLGKVEHSLNGGAYEVIAENQYNELSELSTKDLAGGFQSIDYQYNIRGWLTKMNDPTVDNDSKLFAMELQYDNAGSTYEQYNGNIGSMIWRNPFDDDHNIYQYGYDGLNRLTAADFSQQSGTGSQDFQVKSLDYDDNGNILALERKKKGTIIDDLDYTYQGNQLLSVSDASLNEDGFKDGAGESTEYLYDDNGNMIEDKNKGITSIAYNYLNLPSKVTFASDKYIEYLYDATGIKLSQKVVDGSTIKVTDYLGNFIYNNDSLQLVQHEEGRITHEGGVFEYQYHLKDHLGNVRTTFTPTPEADDTYLATMETEKYATESQNFQNLGTAHTNSSANQTLNGNKAALLNNNSPIGPAMSLQVIPGDVIDLEVHGYYEGGSGYSNTTALNGFAAAVASAFGGTNGGSSESQSIFDGVNDFFTGLGSLNGTSSDNVPAAYLNYILVNQDYEDVASGYVQMSSAANFNPELLSLNNITVTKAGFLYVYVSLESYVSQGVFFDDLKVTHGHSVVVQKDDYYPFGLTFNGYSRPASTGQNYKFGSKEVQGDLDFGWYDFEARFYDPSLGRFANIDPHAESYESINPYNYAFNNPLLFNDPTGMDGTIYLQVILTGNEDKDKALKDAVNSAVTMLNEAYKELDVDLKAEAHFGSSDDLMSKDQFSNRDGAHESDAYVVMGDGQAINSARNTLKEKGWGDIGSFSMIPTTVNEGRAAGDGLAGINIDEMMTKWTTGEWGADKNSKKQDFPSIASKISSRVQHETGHYTFRNHPKNKRGKYFTKEGVPGHIDGTIMQEDPTVKSRHDRLMMWMLRQKHGRVSKKKH